MEEYKVEVIICDAKQEKNKTSTPYLTEAAARAVYKARNLVALAEAIERTNPEAGITFGVKRLIKISSDQTEELLEREAFTNVDCGTF